MTYSIRWREKAKKQLDVIDHYLTYELLNPKAALDFLDLIEEKIRLLSETGTKFRKGPVAGTYEYVISPSTILVYRVFEIAKRIEIIRLLPAAQNT